jgi:ferredoxin
MELPADELVARSLMPPGSAAGRDFSSLAPTLPELAAEACTGCMVCVNVCPDAALYAIAVPESQLAEATRGYCSGERADAEAADVLAHFTATSKYGRQAAARGLEPAKFGLFVDPTKCKGCAECVDACGNHGALAMLKKDEPTLKRFQRTWNFYRKMPETPKQFINEKLLTDMMLAERSLLYVGGAGSCMGCGEGTALRMMLAATGFVYGKENIGIVNSTGCSTVYASTYPYNPYLVPWTNSLFENAPADAIGVRMRWDYESEDPHADMRGFHVEELRQDFDEAHYFAQDAQRELSFVEIKSDQPADESVARSGETLRQAEWRDELLKSGIRGKKGQYILFSRVEPLPGTRWLHAEAETKPNDKGADRVRDPEGIYGKPQRVVISFGPEHAPLEQKQVELAIEEAQTLVPKPKIIVFAAFQFDPEAAKDIDETDWPGVTLLKVQMNADLLTEDLKKKRASNESFWLIGQPDITFKKIKDGDDKGKYRVEVMGFDYYNTKTGTIESGGNEKIAMWLLDTDYDGRSLLPRQVFFPMAGETDGWARLARNLKAEIDEEAWATLVAKLRRCGESAA